MMQVLRFTQNEYSQLVHRALPAWLGLLTAAEKAQRGQQEAVSLPLECVAALLDVAGSLLMKAVWTCSPVVSVAASAACHPFDMQTHQFWPLRL